MKRRFLNQRAVAVIVLSLVLVLALGGAAAMAKPKGGGKNTVSVEQGPLATVMIRVVDYYGLVPLGGTKVELYNAATGFKSSGTTDADGYIKFESVPYNDVNYRAAISKRGYRDSIRILTVDQDYVNVQLIHYPNSSW